MHQCRQIFLLILEVKSLLLTIVSSFFKFKYQLLKCLNSLNTPELNFVFFFNELGLS